MYSSKATAKYTTSKTGYERPNMSHTVTVTRTTTTATTSAIILNTGYLKTIPGLLKIVEVILGGICLGIAAYYWDSYVRHIPPLFFICVSTAVFVGSFCLLLACLISISTGAIISKTIYELIYHFFAMLLMLAASITLMVEENDRRRSSPYLTASIIGLILSGFYLVSVIFAYRSYRGA